MNLQKKGDKAMMIKSPLGIALAAAAVLLAVSPDARKAARKWAVKGTEALLDLSENIRNFGGGDIGKERGILRQEQDHQASTH